VRTTNFFRAAVTLVMLSSLVSPGTTAAVESPAVGKPCRSVTWGGYKASHVFVDFMPCPSARNKLRRWLHRDQLPKNPLGWYCYRLGGVVHACTYPGKRGPGRLGFTFWLRSA